MNSHSRTVRVILKIHRVAILCILASLISKVYLLTRIPKQILLENDSTRYLELSTNLSTNFFGRGLRENGDSFYVTIGYPAFLRLLNFANLKGIVTVQFLLLAAAQFLLYLMLSKRFSKKIAIIGLLLYIAESSSFVESMHVLSETVFTLFFIGFLYLFSRPKGSPGIWVWTGTMLGIAILMRPIGQVVLVALLLLLLTSANRKKLLVIFLAAILIPAGWIARNQMVFDVPQLSGIQNLNLLYYEASGALALESSKPLSVVQAHEGSRERSLLGESPQIEDLVEYRQDRAIDIIRSNPLGLIELHAIGVAKILLGPASSSMREIVSTFSSSNYIFTTVQGLSIALNTLLALLTMGALAWIFTHKGRRKDEILLLCAMTFTLLLISSSGANAYSRFRVPLVPIEILLSMQFVHVLMRTTWIESFGKSNKLHLKS